MKQPQQKSNLVWLDMEMTGLDPEKEGIIEMALIVTDSDLKVIAEGPNLVVHQPERLLKKMDPWNKKQHGSSGLTEAVRQSKITVKAAEKAALEFLKQYCVEGKSPLCGNSVHHDRRFLIKYMPALNRFLHYRIIDVSTIKELVGRWYPAGKLKKLPDKKNAHRALGDILESIEELRLLRKKFFKRPEKTGTGPKADQSPTASHSPAGVLRATPQ